MKIKSAFKLLSLRRDGTLGPLFINRKQVIPLNKWLEAEDHETKGYAHRPGWHVTENPVAPHLSMKGRIWCKVSVKDYVNLKRPASQGSTWLLANWIKIDEVINE